MRLYAYEDRSGDATFGVLVGDRLLTGGQLEKRGQVASPSVDPHYGLGTGDPVVDDWLDALATATRRALEPGRRSSSPETRQPAAVIAGFGPAARSCASG